MADESVDKEEMLEPADSFEVTYESYAKGIYKFLLRRTKDVQLSEDTCQEYSAPTMSTSLYDVCVSSYRKRANRLIYMKSKKPLFAVLLGDI